MELKNNALFKETCFIGGKWIESDSKEKIKVDNPANGEIIGEVPKCSTSETQKAIQEAQSAFPAWRDKTAKERSIIIQKWARLIEANSDETGYAGTRIIPLSDGGYLLLYVPVANENTQHVRANRYNQDNQLINDNIISFDWIFYHSYCPDNHPSIFFYLLCKMNLIVRS